MTRAELKAKSVKLAALLRKFREDEQIDIDFGEMFIYPASYVLSDETGKPSPWEPV